jgi:hypothetical protein
MSFCIRNSVAVWPVPFRATAASPIDEFASSTTPIAVIRASCLARRDPSTRPVVPSSPVRV